MPEWMMINSIEPSVYNEGTCYVAGTKYKTGDFEPYLYKTTDYGKSWKKLFAELIVLVQLKKKIFESEK